MVERYLARLEQEAAELTQNYTFDLETVYLGGGTPSFLRDAEIQQLTESIRRHLGWGKYENTLEVNPGTISLSRAQHWRNLGFDRASVGVQSLHNPTLQFLGRKHDASSALQAIDWLVSSGFRVSGDLITAVAGQPLAEDIRMLAASGVEHISAYVLTIEEGTPFARAGVSVSEQDENAGFFQTAEHLATHGFERYEVSNYARTPQARSRHNIAYWHNRFYAGLGAGASGHYPSANPQYLAQRISRPPLGEWLLGRSGEVQLIDAEEYATDALFMGLRLFSGISLAQLSQTVGFDVAQRYAKVIQQQQHLGLVLFDGDLLQCSPQGRWWLNKIISAFVND